MATDRGDMRLIPGTYEVRPTSSAATALQVRHPVAVTVPWVLPAPRSQTTWLGRAGAAIGSLAAVLALILLLGLIPRALAYLLALID